MVFLVDPKNIVKGGSGCQRKNCEIVCKLCTPLCAERNIQPMYGIPLGDDE